MLWAIPAGMAVMGALNGSRQRDEQVRQNQAQAEVTRYSPWTHMEGHISPVTASAMGGALSGGVSGLALGQQFGGAATPNPEDPTQMQKMAQQNTGMFNSGRFDQMQGMQSAGSSPWALMANRTA